MMGDFNLGEKTAAFVLALAVRDGRRAIYGQITL